MLFELKKHAQAYLDGLTTSREFLGQVVEIVGKEYEAISPDHNDSVAAGDLATIIAEWK